MKKRTLAGFVLMLVVLGLGGALWAGDSGETTVPGEKARGSVDLALFDEPEPNASVMPQLANIGEILARISTMSACDGDYCTTTVSACVNLCYSLGCGFQSWGAPNTNDCRCSNESP